MKQINKIRLEICFGKWNIGLITTREFIHTLNEIVVDEYPTATEVEQFYIIGKLKQKYEKKEVQNGN